MASSRLFIGGLKRNVEKEELIEMFKEFGEISDTWIAYDPPGFAFVEYTTAESAKAALDAKHRTVCFDAEIRVEFTKKRGKEQEEKTTEVEPVQEARIFVGNVKEAIEKEDMKTAFEKFGKVTDVWIAHNPPGFAFVEFEYLEQANLAVKEADGTQMFGGMVKVQITTGRKEGRRNRMNDSRDRRGPRAGAMPRRSPYGPPTDSYSRRPPPARYARDPYARDPYARDPYYADPYARDPYYADPYARDPYYARDYYARRPAPPPAPPAYPDYATTARRPPAPAEPYAAAPARADPYPPRADPYAAGVSDPYAGSAQVTSQYY